MSIGLTGIQISQMAGAAGATKLPMQLFGTLTPINSVVTQQTQSKIDASMPEAQMLNASAAVIYDSLKSTKNEPSAVRMSEFEEQLLADSMNAKAETLWNLAARFLSVSDAFTFKLTGKETKTKPAHVKAAKPKRAMNKNVAIPTTLSEPVKTKEQGKAEQKLSKKRAKAKTNTSIALMDSGIEIEVTPLELPSLPKAAAIVSKGAMSTQAAPERTVQPKVDSAVAQAKGPFESVVPYSVSQLDRARTILLAAGVEGQGATALPFTRTTHSPAISRIDPRGTPVQKKDRASQRTARKDTSTKPARTFKRSHAVGRSPAFLVGNIRARKSRKDEPAQIVRVAIAGKTSRRIVFARVPGTRGEYRFAGIDRQQRTPDARRLSTQHALGTPHAERQLQPTTLGLAPPAVGGGETAYTMPEPRELRADERQVLMSMLKDQLAKGPASLGDHAIREQFNAFMFSNTVGEMSHYVTADQWNAMVRATVLYAARAVLPFSNNSVTGTAAEYLFDNADAEQRYDEWVDHFGISGLRDIALMDTFADEERILTMPEYFLKGIMDYLADLAPIMHAYDEDVMPLPFSTELNLQWETIAFIHDPAISNDEELISATTAFAEELAALDVQAAQHFVELALISTRVTTDSIQGVWNEDQAIALVSSCIEAGLGDIVDSIGRNRDLPRRPRRLVAMAKEARNAQEDTYELGLEMLTRNLADAIQNGSFSIESDEEELHLN